MSNDVTDIFHVAISFLSITPCRRIISLSRNVEWKRQEMIISLSLYLHHNPVFYWLSKITWLLRPTKIIHHLSVLLHRHLFYPRVVICLISTDLGLAPLNNLYTEIWSNTFLVPSVINKYISNLECTMLRFWKNLHQLRSKSKDWNAKWFKTVWEQVNQWV